MKGLFLALAVAVGGARAEETVFGKDDRVKIGPSETAWSAVGRIDTEKGHCTGTLVAPDVVLTAAHCVTHRGTGKLVERFVFRAGASEEGAAGAALAARVGDVIDAVRAQGDMEEDWGEDWALVRLASALGDRAGTIPLAPAAGELRRLANAPLGAVGYPADLQAGGWVATRQFPCRVRRFWKWDGVAFTDCDAVLGMSGGPVLITLSDGRVVLAGILARAGLPAAVPEYSDNHPTVVIATKRFRDAVLRASLLRPPG